MYVLKSLKRDDGCREWCKYETSMLHSWGIAVSPAELRKLAVLVEDDELCEFVDVIMVPSFLPDNQQNYLY